jgi:Met-zincin/Domain of unknown function (DUF5117)
MKSQLIAPILPNNFRLARLPLAILASFTVLAAATAHAQAPATPPAGAPAGAATPAGAPPAASAAKPFKDVIKDAKEIPGLFTLYQKEEKIWLAIKPEQFDKPMFFSYNIPTSVGERGLYASQMGSSEVVVFKKIGSQVQLIAKNLSYYAQPGTPEADFVSQAFSDSLLGGATAASLPHPDSKAILIDLNSLLINDIPGYATRLDFAYRMGFALDKTNSSFNKVHNSDTLTGIGVNAHFSVAKISAPPLTPSPVPMPAPPQTVPDSRSMFIGFYYSFTELPATPMAARKADDRLGHFVTTRTDYSNDIAIKDKLRLVNRWRLEKKDPNAAMSEPVTPITYWIDKNVPMKYRKAVNDGIVEWNKAYEKIGFKNAVIARQQTEADNFDTMDARHASIRWFVGADVGFAIGPSQVDPRSGEILDADIGMSDVFAKGMRRQVVEDFTHPTSHVHSHKPGQAFMTCNYAHEAASEMHFASDLLEARGLEMDGPEAEALAQAYVKAVIMHEVGHTLGLRHNFRSSTIYTLKQLSDPAFGKVNSLAGSVMDYTPVNLAPKGAPQGEYFASTLGPYDYWAIEYAYKPLNAATETVDLEKIASRSNEPLLAYATDEDAGLGESFYGIDPEVNRFDLGANPMDYYKQRLQLSRELWDRIQTMELKTGESYERLTRSFNSGFRALERIAPLVAKYVGGVKHLRDHAGTGRPVYEPTAAAKQREALKIITDGMLKVDSFKFKPEFISRIGADYFGRFDGVRPSPNPDVSSISTRVGALQREVLDTLLANNVASRLLSSQEKVADGSKLLKLSDLYDTLQDAIWSELKTGGDISSMRRNLQREHIKRLSETLIKPAASLPADARSLQRENAVLLSAAIRSAQGKAMSKEAKAHLAESLNTLTEALRAPLARAGA